jgi:Tfp pilus assembly protein PilO
MNEEPLDQTNIPEENEPEIIVNEYGETRDSAVVVDEADRTVLLTENETVVIDKEPRIDIVPANRPRKVYTGMWGQPELITAGLAMFALLTVVLLYVFMVLPANSELERNKAERDRLEAELFSAREKYGKITDTKTHVEQLMSSVDAFESNYLPVEANGRASLYQRINGLITGHGLINTTGPDYAPLETVDKGDGVQTDEERGRSKYRSLFPGVYVSMTVEGSYQNIRRFIREVETGGDFVVVSAVELEPSDAEGRSEQPNDQSGQPVANPDQGFPPGFGSAATQTGPPARQRGKMHGGVVSLRMEMAAYFRRPNVVPQVPVTEQ